MMWFRKKTYFFICHVCGKIYEEKMEFCTGNTVEVDGVDRITKQCGEHQPGEVRTAWLNNNIQKILEVRNGNKGMVSKTLQRLGGSKRKRSGDS